MMKAHKKIRKVKWFGSVVVRALDLRVRLGRRIAGQRFWTNRSHSCAQRRLWSCDRMALYKFFIYLFTFTLLL